MRASHNGFSMVELMVTLVISLLISVGAYRIVTHTNLRGVRAVQKTKAAVEANKAMDRLASEIQNAVSFSNAKYTLFGSVPNAASGDCGRFPQIIYPGYNSGFAFDFVAHGLVPLPGLEKGDIDNADMLLLLNPDSISEGSIQNKNDALRIAFIPVESNAIRVMLHVVKHTATENTQKIMLDAAELAKENLQVGDYAVIFDHLRRELIRITHVGPDYVEHDSLSSFWNLRFVYIDPSTGIPKDDPFPTVTNVFLQKVLIDTYAYDSATRTLWRDNHLLDGGFDPNTKTFDTGKYDKRIPNWEAATRNLSSFTVEYEVHDETPPPRTPRAALPIAKCNNQLGYSNFMNVHVNAVLAVDEPELQATPIELRPKMGLVRRLSNPNLQNQPGSLSVQQPDPPITYQLPTPVPVVPTPGDTPTPVPPSFGNDPGSGH